MSGGVWYSTFLGAEAEAVEEEVDWLEVEQLLFGRTAVLLLVKQGGCSSSEAETGVRERGELDVEEGSRGLAFWSEYCDDPAEE